MSKIKYFKIKSSIDPMVTGIKSGKEQIIDLIDQYKNKEILDKYQNNYQSFLDDSLNLNIFRSHIQAKATDFLSTIFLKTEGFFISEKFKDSLKFFKINNSKLLDTTINGHQCDNWKYYYLNILDTDSINYKKTTFRIDELMTSFRDGGIFIDINTKEELLKSGEVQFKKDPMLGIMPSKVILKKPAHDIIVFPNSIDKYCSEFLRNHIEKEDLTGIEFEETDIEFYIED